MWSRFIETPVIVRDVLSVYRYLPVWDVVETAEQVVGRPCSHGSQCGFHRSKHAQTRREGEGWRRKQHFAFAVHAQRLVGAEPAVIVDLTAVDLDGIVAGWCDEEPGRKPDGARFRRCPMNGKFERIFRDRHAGFFASLADRRALGGSGLVFRRIRPVVCVVDSATRKYPVAAVEGEGRIAPQI